MSKLPSGWDETTIGEVSAYVSRGKSPKYADKSSLPVVNQKAIRWYGIQNKYLKFVHEEQFKQWTPERFIRAGDILWNSTGTGTIGRACLVRAEDIDPPKVVDSHVTIVRPSSTIIDPRFLFGWIRGPEVQNGLEELASGSTNQIELNRSTVVATRVPLAPLPEQKRIADKLEALLARITACRDHLERVPRTLKRFRQSVLAAATSGELTREWRLSNDVADSGFEQRVTVGSVCTESFYGPRFGRDEYTDEGVPTIRTTDMTSDGRIDITDNTPRVHIPKDKFERFAVRRGDLLITRTGSIGVMAVFDDDYAAVPSAYLIRFRFSDAVLPRFMFFCLTAPEGQERLGLSATAITQPNINAEAIKRIKIPLPTLAEQQELIRRTDELLAFADRVEERFRSGAELVTRLVPAALAKAFRGELVPQDPNDEPAEKLLERIKIERSISAVGSRGGRTMTKRNQMNMSVSGKDAMKAAILNMKSNTFSFDDLREEVSGDYESLKAAVFELLDASEPIIRQVFNKKAETIQFERVTS